MDQRCTERGIEHRLIPPGRPQTNGMVERFNGRIAEVLRTYPFRSRDDLEATLKRYVWLYNHHLPQKAISHRTPIQTMEDWQAYRPGIFKLLAIIRDPTAKEPTCAWRRDLQRRCES